MLEMTPRQLSWIYLRDVLEASRSDVLELLWPEGWQTRRLTGRPGDVERVAGMIRARDRALPQSLLRVTEATHERDPRKIADSARVRGWSLLTPDSAQWPTELTDAFVRMEGAGADSDSGVRGQAEAPFALWVRGEGNLAALTRSSVTIVGTRAATRYGRSVTHRFATELAGHGYTIVSGGAMGIDAVAHSAALDSGAPTVILAACGLDVDYPAKHRDLFARAVAVGSVVVSEYAPGTPPARHRFLTRNRLAAALGNGTVMVEAAVRSGALNTMNWAEAMLKPTMVVPGPVDSAMSHGGLLRIQQGRSELVRNVEDILGHVEPLGRQLELELDRTDGRHSGPRLGWQETSVYDATGIAADATGTLDDMVVATGLTPGQVMRIIRQLEKLGVVEREGDRWLKVPGSSLQEL